MAVCAVYPGGLTEWRLNGKLHREDGPAVELFNGCKSWYLHGQRHREDGPASEYPGRSRSWYIRDERHRMDGPAIELVNGSKFWYFEGHELTEEQHTRIRSRIERAEKARQHRIKWFIHLLRKVTT